MRKLGTYLKAISILLLTVHCFFVAPADASEISFDVNDINILFPFHSQNPQSLYPDLRADSVISKKLFASVVTHFLEATGGELHSSFVAPNYTPDEIHLFHIVNFRYDPCFATTPDINGPCVQQMRLVLQPVTPPSQAGLSGFTKQVRVQDFSMHLLFSLGNGVPLKTDSVLSELRRIKKISEQWGFSNLGFGLTVSPALTKELGKYPKTNGPLASALKALILKLALPKNLSEITVINGSDNDSFKGQWNFLGGKVSEDGWNIEPIPTLKPAVRLETTDFEGTTQYFSLPLDRPLETLKSPFRTSQDAAHLLSELELVQNPNRTHPKNIDCASCHLAAISEMNLLHQAPYLAKSSGNVNAGQANLSDFVVSETLPAYDESTLFGDVHVIGYFENSPVATPLVAHSAARSATLINQILGLTRAP